MVDLSEEFTLGEKEFRLHPHMKKRPVYNISKVDEEDIARMNRFMKIWFAWFKSQNDMDKVDVDLFFRSFYDFFMTCAMKKDSIQRTYKSMHTKKRPLSVKTRIKILMRQMKKSTNEAETLENFIYQLQNPKEIKCILDDNGGIEYNPFKIAESANSYLTSVMNPALEVEEKNCPNTSKPFILTVDMVRKTLMELKPKGLRTTGILVMNADMLKLTVESSAVILHDMFCRSITQKKLPKDWLHSLITLKHKNGDRRRLENYRPIGITCAPSKILEIIMAQHLREAMEKRINPNQHGSRKGHSQESQLVCVHEQLILRASEFGRVDCIQLDFTKAGDKVVHSILIEKLRQLVINPLVVDWVRAFLTDRMQSVKVGNAISHPRKVTSGLPQGSPLSNVLLMIYVNDLMNELDSTKQQVLYQYCDDTLITQNITSLDDCLQLQGRLDALEKWMIAHHMETNMSKCSFLSFQLKGKAPQYDKWFPYKLLGEVIEYESHVKYLGIQISGDFTWTEHVKYLTSGDKGRKMLSDIERMKQVPPRIKKNCYRRFMRSNLEKCCAIWTPSLRQENYEIVQQLEDLQEKALEGVRNHRFQPLAERRIKFVLILLSNIIKKHKPYLKIAASLDICDVNFKFRDFETYMELEDSIVGAAIRELIYLEDYLRSYTNSETSIKTLVRQGNMDDPVLQDYCAFRYKNFMDGYDEIVDFNNIDALFYVSTCFHPKYSVDKIRKKIREVSDFVFSPAQILSSFGAFEE